MIYWAPFLHFYQPSFQFHKVLEKICAESYLPLLKVFFKYPQAKVTVNISGSLTELLYEHQGRDILKALKKLSGRGQLEFADSAKYHPILPLIPLKEVRRQIKLNREINQSVFGRGYRPVGFFPPEMASSAKLLRLIRKLGYQWILLSGVAHQGAWPLDFISAVSKKSSLKIIFRDDIVSNEISFRKLNSESFINKLREIAAGKKDTYIITAMDAETFGHHIPQWENLFLAKVLQNILALQKKIPKEADNRLIKIVTVSQLLEIFPTQEARHPKPSSWSSSEQDLNERNYYPLWKDPQNPIHNLQWKHLDICCQLLYQALRLKTTSSESREFAAIARVILDKAFLSCQFWWANKNKNLWSISLINKGLTLQEEAAFYAFRAISSSSLDSQLKKTAENRYLETQGIISQLRGILAASLP